MVARRNIADSTTGSVGAALGALKEKLISTEGKFTMKTIFLLFAAGFLVSGCSAIRPYGIDSFEECEAAGYPVMESHPRQCRADGQIFTEELDPAGQSQSK